MTAAQFETAFCRYAEAHIGSILARAEADRPRFRRLETTFQKGDYLHSVVETPWYAGLPPGIHDPDFPTELATECAKIGLNHQILPIPSMTDAAGKPITNPTFDQVKLWEFSELRWPIVRGFERFGLKHLTTKQIESALKPYIQVWKTRAWPHITFSALRNLEGDFHKIHLGRGISIERVTDTQRNYFWARYAMDWTIPIRHYALSPYFMIIRYQQPMAGPQAEFVPNIIEDAVTAMRLLKQGDIGIDGLSSMPVLNGSGFSSLFSPRSHLQLDFVFFGRPYRLEKQEISRFHRLFKLLHLLHPDRKSEFVIPLSRFNRAYSRQQGDDATIDIAVCLESLLLRGLNDELSYRFAIRGAKLLERVNAPRETFSILHQFYQIRSQVVHGGEHVFTPKMEQRISQRFPGLTSHTFIEKVTALVRKIIIQMLWKASLGNSIQSICADLDAAAVG
jgi:hypothetical protein